MATPRVPITIRAMLAADCSDLPSELRHFIHVLALHANNWNGRGLTGQALLARYMGVSRRSVVRLWARLDALWNAAQSPVGALREGRWHSSDAYTLVVAAGAPLRLESEDNVGAVPGVNVTPEAVNVTSETVNVTPTTGQSDTGGTLSASQCDTGVTLTTQLRSTERNYTVDRTTQRTAGSPALSRGPAGAGETTEGDEMAAAKRRAAKRRLRAGADARLPRKERQR